mgnify:FL=1
MLKYDLFRRLNTGGQPLNNQEIRNCLSRRPLQVLLKNMIDNETFKRATGYSIRNTRMEAQELALKFICFYNKYDSAKFVKDYNGNMDATLNNEVETLNILLTQHLDMGDTYRNIFEKSLNLAHSLFGNYTFRKVFPDYREQRRYQINKSLFLGITVTIASNFDKYIVLKDVDVNMIDQLAKLIESDSQFFNAMTWSTNSRYNINYVFEQLKVMFDTVLNTISK